MKNEELAVIEIDLLAGPIYGKRQRNTRPDHLTIPAPAPAPTDFGKVNDLRDLKLNRVWNC